MEKVRIGNDIEVKYTVLRDGKPVEFAAYNPFAEECKMLVPELFK